MDTTSSYQLPPLPYSKDALEPHISAETVKFHYEKHHAGYVAKLNGLLGNAVKSLEELVRTAEGSIFNNAAQIWNHTFYWNSMKPNGGGEPSDPLRARIINDFGSFSNFKEAFNVAAGGHFGSGWAWLVLGQEKLKIYATSDAGNPMRDGTGIPLLTCDVWEHAYYIDYRNDRAKYLTAWWNVVNWDFANENYKKAMN